MNYFDDYVPNYEDDQEDDTFLDSDLSDGDSYMRKHEENKPHIHYNPNSVQCYFTLGDCLQVHSVEVLLIDRDGYSVRSHYINLPWSDYFWINLMRAFSNWLRGFKPYNPSDDIDHEF